MRQTRKNIYDVSRCTISDILKLKLPFCSSGFDSSNSVPVAWASCFCFLHARCTAHSATKQLPKHKRAADNTADDLEETPCLEPPHTCFTEGGSSSLSVDSYSSAAQKVNVRNVLSRCRDAAGAGSSCCWGRIQYRASFG